MGGDVMKYGLIIVLSLIGMGCNGVLADMSRFPRYAKVMEVCQEQGGTPSVKVMGGVVDAVTVICQFER
jgi:hypothetical protein